MSSYRMDFSIQRAGDEGGDYEEIGFGASFSRETIDAALYDVDSIIQNDMWETSGDMPEPKDVRAKEGSGA